MPSLLDLLSDPRRIGGLTRGEAAAALIELAGLQTAIAAKLSASPDSAPESGSEVDGDRLLTADDVAQRFQRSVDWVYRNSGRWPFTRRLTRRTVRFSE